MLKHAQCFAEGRVLHITDPNPGGSRLEKRQVSERLCACIFWDPVLPP